MDETTRAPSFLVIGAARSGTTTLTRLVAAHPDGFVTQPKEPHFFAFAGTRPRFAGPGDEEGLNRIAVTDLDVYRALYAGSDDSLARGEGSVSTLYYPERSIPNIRRWFPSVRLVVILRDPVERAFSAHQYLRTLGHEDVDDFEQALDLEPQRVADNWHHLWHYAGMGFYGRQLAPFIDAFGRDRVKVLFQEEMAEDTVAVGRELFGFLGLDPEVELGAQQSVNASGELRRPTLFRAMRAAAHLRAVRWSAERVLPPGAKQRIRSASFRRGAIPAAASDRLRTQFADDVAMLRTLIGEAGPRWLSASTKPEVV